MKLKLFIFLFLIPIFGLSQWTKTSVRSQKVKESQKKLEFAALYSLDIYQLKNTLKDAPVRLSNTKGVIIVLPTASGTLEKFQIWEHSNMDPELQKKYTDIRSYVGISVNDPSAY